MPETAKVKTPPWMPTLVMGSGFVLVGVLPIAFLWQEAPDRQGLMMICLASCFIGLAMLKRVWARFRGTQVEKRTLRRLRIPIGWSMQTNVPLKRGGDLDLLVIDARNHRYAVEIKSYQSVLLRRRGFRGTEELRYQDGRPFSRDPVEQVLRAAEETDALPILWLPEAKSARTYQMKCGVRVVQGGSRNLLKAIGAKRWF